MNSLSSSPRSIVIVLAIFKPRDYKFESYNQFIRYLKVRLVPYIFAVKDNYSYVGNYNWMFKLVKLSIFTYSMIITIYVTFILITKLIENYLSIMK